MKRRILAMLLAIVMLFSMFPTAAFAADGDDDIGPAAMTMMLTAEPAAGDTQVTVSCENMPEGVIFDLYKGEELQESVNGQVDVSEYSFPLFGAGSYKIVALLEEEELCKLEFAVPAEEPPVEEPPVEEQLTEEQPAEEPPAKEPPVEEQLTEE